MSQETFVDSGLEVQPKVEPSDGDSLPTSSSTPDSSDLSWRLLVLTKEKLASLWEQFKEFPVAFDDVTKGDPQHFMKVMFDPTNIFYEIYNEDDVTVGIASAASVRPRIDAVIHLTMFDRRLRGREELFRDILADLFNKAALRRVTAAVPGNRATTRKLLERLSFTHEGVLREAMPFEGQFVDVNIYGLLREEL